MSLPEQIRLLGAGEFWFLAAAAVAAALAGFYFAFRHLGRARLVEDTPTARIRSAPQGYVELEGEVKAGGEAVIAPLTQSPCCWYRFKIERRGDKKWSTVEQGTSEVPFVLDDGTDRCLVDPHGAEVTPTDRSVWYGWSEFPTDRAPQRVRVAPRTAWLVQLAIQGQADVSSRYRYTEERIYPGDRLYAIGSFDSLGELGQQQERQELLRERLQGWKQDRTRLLALFDRNRDGEIDPGEWEHVRRAAAAEVARDYAQELPGRILHSLRRPDTGQPYLLSSLPQFELARRHRLYAGLSAGFFFAAGSAATFLLSNRFF